MGIHVEGAELPVGTSMAESSQENTDSLEDETVQDTDSSVGDSPEEKVEE